MRKTKAKKIEKKLSVVRRVSYTFFAFTIFELSGVFALAGLKGLYVITETKSNAFYPKSYVDVGIKEPNGQEYGIVDDVVVNADGDGKQVYIENAGSSKRSVILRAKIVAEIYDEVQDIYYGSLSFSDDYAISVNGDSTYNDKSSNLWYYSDGYYYYTSILDINANTTDLFDKVEFEDTGLAKIPDGYYVKFHVVVDCLDASVAEKVDDYWGSDVPQDLEWR